MSFIFHDDEKCWKITPSQDADELGFLVELERMDILRAGDSVYRFVFLVARSSKVFYPYLSTLFSFVAVAVCSSHMD